MNWPDPRSREKALGGHFRPGPRRRPAGPRNRSPTRSAVLRRTLHRGEGLLLPAQPFQRLVDLGPRRPRPPGRSTSRVRRVLDPSISGRTSRFHLVSRSLPLSNLTTSILRLPSRDAARAPRWSPLVGPRRPRPPRTSPITESPKRWRRMVIGTLPGRNPGSRTGRQAPPAGWSRVFRLSAAGTTILELAPQPFGAGFGDLHRTQGLFRLRSRRRSPSGSVRLIFPVPDRKQPDGAGSRPWSSSPPGEAGMARGGGREGLEPPRLSSLEPKSSASTSSATPAGCAHASRDPGHATRPAGPTAAPNRPRRVAPRGRQPAMSGVAASDPSGGL